MSGSWNSENELRAIAEKLRHEADDLERCADTLKVLREYECHEPQVRAAKERARAWLKGKVRG